MPLAGRMIDVLMTSNYNSEQLEWSAAPDWPQTSGANDGAVASDRGTPKLMTEPIPSAGDASQPTDFFSYPQSTVPAGGSTTGAVQQGQILPANFVPGPILTHSFSRSSTLQYNSVSAGVDQTGSYSDPGLQNVYWHYNPGPEIYAKKIFVGGLPIDIDEDEIKTRFGRFGRVYVDWPYKSRGLNQRGGMGFLPFDRRQFHQAPFGYVFLVYEHEKSVHDLMEYCHREDHDRYFMCISSPTMKDKPVQVRPWRLADADFIVDSSLPLDPRKAIFVGAVPRPMKAKLAYAMNKLYGNVAYAGIDTDPEFRYPKGSGRVVFNQQQSYLAAISARYVQLRIGDLDKRVEVKPYILDNQMCDVCQGGRCAGCAAPFFCASAPCFQYYCEKCWSDVHATLATRDPHRPLVRDTSERYRRYKALFP